MNGRKIIQIVCAGAGANRSKEFHLYALCEDGTVWVWCPTLDRWHKLPEIPKENSK